MAKVRITILNDERSEGQLQEHYEAAQVNDAWWQFEPATLAEGKVIIEAFDLAGNCTKHSRVQNITWRVFT